MNIKKLAIFGILLIISTQSCALYRALRVGSTFYSRALRNRVHLRKMSNYNDDCQKYKELLKKRPLHFYCSELNKVKKAFDDLNNFASPPKMNPAKWYLDTEFPKPAMSQAQCDLYVALPTTSWIEKLYQNIELSIKHEFYKEVKALEENKSYIDSLTSKYGYVADQKERRILEYMIKHNSDISGETKKELINYILDQTEKYQKELDQKRKD